jgi:TPR repeat protein
MTDAPLLSLSVNCINFLMTRRTLWRIPLIGFIDERTRCRRGIIPVMKSLNPSPRLAFILAALALILPAGLLAGMTPAEVMKYNTTSAYAGNGDKLAQYNLGVCFSSGLGVKTDPAQAVAWWRKSAAQGFAPAMYNLGYSYVNGIGTKQDLALGVSWYRKSADLGHVPAMCNLGICYEDGVGIRADAAEAIKWLGKAAAKGDVAATIRLDLMRSRLEADKARPANTGAKAKGASGSAAPSSQPLSKEYLKVLEAKALAGDAVAQVVLGHAYRYGNGVDKDPAIALRWFRESAELGNPTAQYYLGRSYYDFTDYPSVVRPDHPLAVSWWLKSAAQGTIEAMEALGFCYSRGYGGLTKNDVEAYAYLSLASPKSRAAQSQLSVLERVMTLAAREAGANRAAELSKEITISLSTRKKTDSGGTSGGGDKLEQSKKAKEAELLRKGA